MARDSRRSTRKPCHSTEEERLTQGGFTFLHAADIHLDSPLVGLERYGDAPVDELRGATRRAFQAMVDAAIEEAVSFVLLAGDLYDGDWKDYNTGLFFAQQMARLADAGIDVFVVSGNHDAANQFTKSLRTPSRVRKFSTSHAETHRLPDLQVAIHGRGFATKEVTEDLSRTFPEPVPGWFNIGLLHTSLDGRPGHATYAPCSLDGLLANRYDYWALGHVHAREIVHETPWVVFPGNLQGRHAREIGPKGCTLVTVVEGSVRDVREIHLDVLRWGNLPVDLSGATTLDEVMARVADKMRATVGSADGRMVALRLGLHGMTRVHASLMANPEHFRQELRALALDCCGDRLWLEKVRFSTQAQEAAVPEGGDVESIAALVRTIKELTADEELVAELTRLLLELRAKLPDDLVSPEALEPLDPASPEFLGRIVSEARELLLARLVSGES